MAPASMLFASSSPRITQPSFIFNSLPTFTIPEEGLQAHETGQSSPTNMMRSPTGDLPPVKRPKTFANIFSASGSGTQADASTKSTKALSAAESLPPRNNSTTNTFASKADAVANSKARDTESQAKISLTTSRDRTKARSALKSRNKQLEDAEEYDSHSKDGRDGISSEGSNEWIQGDDEVDDLEAIKLQLDKADPRYTGIVPVMSEDQKLRAAQTKIRMLPYSPVAPGAIPAASIPFKMKEPRPTAEPDTLYTHPAGKHSSHTTHIPKIPFDLYDCPVFIEYIAENCLDEAWLFPSKTEFQGALDTLKDDYPGYLAKCNARKAELENWKDEAGNPKPKSWEAKQIWQDHHPKDHDWFFVWPLVQPGKLVADDQRRLNAQAARSRAKEKRAIKRDGSSGVDLEHQTLEKPLILPASATTPPPASSTGAFGQDPRTTPGTLVSNEISDQKSPRSLNSLFYGVTDYKQLPPPVVRLITNTFQIAYNAFAHCLEQLAGENGELVARKHPDARENSVFETTHTYSERVANRALHTVYGGWAVLYVGFEYLLAASPPGQAVIPGYGAAIKSLRKAWCASYARKDQQRFQRYCRWDTEAAVQFQPLVASEESLTDELIVKYSKDMEYCRLRYQSEHVGMPGWLLRLQERFWDKAKTFSVIDTSSFTDPTKVLRIRQIQSALQEREANIEDILQGQVMSKSFKSLVRKAAANQSVKEESAEGDMPCFSEMECDEYKAWDAWDFVTHLGIEDVQQVEAFELADELSKEDAHQYKMTEDGKIELDDAGEPQWINPKHHFARAHIIWPNLNEFEKIPRDQHEWELIVAGDPTTQRSEATHARITPSRHQIIAVARMVDRGWAYHHCNEGAQAHTLLCDDVGLGKTLVGMMFIALLHFYDSKRPKGNRPRHEFNEIPAVAPFKTHLVPQDKGIAFEALRDEASKITETDLKQMERRWVGDILPRTTLYRPISLFLASKTVSANHRYELETFLSPESFAIVVMDQRYRGSAPKRARLSKDISAFDSQTHVVVVASYEDLASQSVDFPLGENGSDPSNIDLSIFSPKYRFQLLFADEIHELRNPNSQFGAALTRAARQARYSIGATATPVYTSPLDIVTAARNLLIPAVYDTTSIEQPGIIKDSLDAVNEKVETGKQVVRPSKALLRARATYSQTKPWVSECLRDYKQIIVIRNKIESTYQKALEEIELVDKPERRAVVQSTDITDTILSDDDDPDAPPQDIIDKGEPHLAYWKAKAQVRADLKSLLDTIRRHLQRYIVRRLRTTRDNLELPIVSYQEPNHQVLWVKMESFEAEVYHDFATEMKERSNFQTLARRLSTEPFMVQWGWFDIQQPESSKIKKVVELVERILKEDEDLPCHLQRKILIHTVWTGLVPAIQARLASHKIYTSTLSGQTPIEARAKIVTEFQADQDHHSEEIWYPKRLPVIQDSREAIWEEVPVSPSRVMIITNVATAGINLFRASELILMDPGWTREETVQITGRVVRRGQTRPVNVYAILVKETTDTWMTGLSSRKQETSDLLLRTEGSGRRDNDIIDLQLVSSDDDPSKRVIPQLHVIRHAQASRAGAQKKLRLIRMVRGIQGLEKVHKATDDPESSRVRAEIKQSLSGLERLSALDRRSRAMSGNFDFRDGRGSGEDGSNAETGPSRLDLTLRSIESTRTKRLDRLGGVEQTEEDQ